MSFFPIKYYILVLVSFSLFTSQYLFGNENASTLLVYEESQKIGSGSFLFLPQVGLQVEAKLFSNNKAHNKIETNRIIDLDILRYRNFVFSMFINEIVNYNDTGPDYFNPELIRYEMDFGSIKCELKYGVLSWFFDHNCSNVINENETEDRRLRWYGFGIRWESYGMRPGQRNIENHNNNYFFLKNLYYKVSVGRAIHTRVFDYDYLVTGTLRYDLFNYDFFIPYIEGSFTSLIDNRMRFNRYYEAGIRLRFSKGDLTPFLGINHKYDIDYYNGTEANLYYIGLRLETVLSKEQKTQNIETIMLFPDFHFSGSYGKYINNNDLNFNTDILVGLDFLSSFQISPFINYKLVHNSLAEHSGMFPRYIQHNIEAGISYTLNYFNALMEPHYVYKRFDDGNFYNGYSEYVNMAILRISSIKMKTGNANNSIDFNKESPDWLNRIDWMISAGRSFNKYKYTYTWEYNIKIIWNMFRYYKIIPYISVDMIFLKDENYDEIYSAEPGVRIQNGLYWMLFYRYEYRTAVDPANGFFRDYHIAGIRIEI